MRKIIVVRGPQGSGKTTLLADAGLADNMLSADRMRLAMGGPTLGYHGRMMLPQHRNMHVWEAVMASLDARMGYAETIGFEATLPTWKDMIPILRTAQRHRYDILVVDMYDIDREILGDRNEARTGLGRMTPAAVARTVQEHGRGETEIAEFRRGLHKGNHDMQAYCDLAKGVPVIHWRTEPDLVDAIRSFIRLDVQDLSHYDRVVHVGDVQGCHSAMVGPGSPLESGLQDDAFYVFCGDLLDRGVENGEVMRWMLDNVVHRDNVVLLRGNHEDHGIRYEDGQLSAAREFNFRTAPQLQAAGIGPAAFTALNRRLVDAFPYVHRGTRVLVTHAGLPVWPDDLHMVPGQQCVTGTGNYSDPVDDQFTQWSLDHEARTGERLWQVHGHRNRLMLPIAAAARSFNLEGQTDFGGHVRFVTLRDGEFIPAQVRNRVFRGVKEWSDIDMQENRKPHGPAAPLAPWVRRGEALEPCMDAADVAAFRAHGFVTERPSASLPHVASFAFTKDAFHSKMWDAVTTQARGMFLDLEDGHFVNRGYRKFFNWGERAETTTESLRQTMRFPVRGYLKENGFLGLAGYDRKTDSLILSSKSMIEGEFADMFREIAMETIGEAGLERLYRTLRDQGATAAFEVIDPSRDPHIVGYGDRHVVLLDLIRRSTDDESMPYEDLQKLGAYIGVRVKEACFTIPNFDALLKRMTPAMEDKSWRWHGREIEGIVLQDADGRIVKVKTAWYSFWKWMRSVKDRVALCRRTGRPFGRVIDDETGREFLAFCERQPDEVLGRDIVELRAAFLKDPMAVVEGVAAYVEPEPVPRDMTGYERGIDALASQIRAGTAKRASIIRLIEQAADDPDRRRALEGHADRGLIQEYVAAST